jgi:hypothetical protein
MKRIFKNYIFKAFRHALVFLDKNPRLRRKVYFFICSYGLYNFLKKFYAGRLHGTSTGQFSPLMVGPVVVLDISEEQLSVHAREIYFKMKNPKILHPQKSNF